MAEYEDQTAVYDIGDDFYDPAVVGPQEIWRSYVNDLGPSSEETLQIADVMDYDDMAELFDLTEGDDLDVVLDEKIRLEMMETENTIPNDWKYWEHTPSTIPPVDESNAPPMPSGWVNPDTDELVP